MAPTTTLQVFATNEEITRTTTTETTATIKLSPQLNNTELSQQQQTQQLQQQQQQQQQQTQSQIQQQQQHTLITPAVPSIDNTTTDKQDFIWKSGQACHNTRAAAIRKAFPEVLSLEGNDPTSAIGFTLVSLAHLSVAALMATSSLPTWCIVVVAWTFGGFFANYAALAMHESSHGLVFKSRPMAAAIGFVAGIPLFLPAFAPFQYYHKLHHAYMTVELDAANPKKYDTDLPTKFEAMLFSKTPLHRLLFLFLMPLTYSIRPMVLCPRAIGMTDVMNTLFCVVLHTSMYMCFGFRAIIYLLSAALLGQGIHPGSMHFVAEHYVLAPYNFDNTPLIPDTYSYYGWQNKVMLNGGYHVEHHDFPKIPCTRLPLLRKMAAPFYDNLQSFDSYFDVFFRFLFRSEHGYQGIWRRVKSLKPGKAE